MYRKAICIESKPEGEEEKSRSFRVELLAWVMANPLWSLGATAKERVLRPVFLAFAGSASASRAFRANLQSGRTAAEPGAGGLRFEIPKSAGFRYDTSGKGEGCLTLAYLPHVFSLQPGSSEEDSISFVAMPPKAWVDEQARAIYPVMGADAREAARAAYFVAYLDARTPLPIANDLRFHLELFRAAREQSWCCESEGYDHNPGSLFALGVSDLGFESPLLCNVAPAVFADFLAQQTARLLPRQLRPEVQIHGTTDFRRPRRVLPHSRVPSAQLSLFGEL